jgi:DNA-binding XRE family transcriptional regulator
MEAPTKAQILRELRKGEGILAAAEALGFTPRAFRAVCDRHDIDREKWRRDTRNQTPRATPGKPSPLGKSMARWRKQKGLSRAEAAAKCGLAPIQIYHLENGHVVGERYIPQIARAWRRNPRDLALEVARSSR